MKNCVILIPSYEPDELLLNTVNELTEADFPIMIVNDGSGREFDHVFESVKDKVVYFSYEKNMGKGYAMKYGYKRLLESYPDAKYVITADGDGQHTTKDIIRVYEEMERTNELVFGVREFDKDVPARSKAGNNFSKATRSLVTKTYIQDDQCGLRGFPIRYLDELIRIHGNRYEYEMNQITLFQMKQYPLIPIVIETVYLDSNSRSHFSPFKDTMRIQSKIVIHGLLAMACCILNIALASVFIKSNIFPIGYPFNIITPIFIADTGVFGLYFILSNIIYPSKRFFRRLWKELLFLVIRTSIHFIALTPIFAHPVMTDFAPLFVPLIYICTVAANILFTWLFRKVFKTF